MAWRETAGTMLGAATRIFGDSVVFTRHRDSRQFTAPAVWKSPHAALDVGAEVTVTSGQPALGVKLTDLGFDPVNNDRVTGTDGVKYKIIDVQRDGIAGATLILERA